MAITAKFLGGATLTGSSADIYTVPVSTTTRVSHIVISNSTTAGTVTLSFFDDSSATAYELLNGVAIAANETIEFYDVLMEASDKIQASAATTTGAKITIFGYENA